MFLLLHLLQLCIICDIIHVIWLGSLKFNQELVGKYETTSYHKTYQGWLPRNESLIGEPIRPTALCYAFAATTRGGLVTHKIRGLKVATLHTVRKLEVNSLIES